MFYDIWLGGQLLWNIPLLVCLFGVAVLYGFLIWSYTNIKLHHKQPLLLFLSLGILYVSFGSPFAAISHLSFSMHMLQLSILYFIIPPLFLLGIPDALIQQYKKLTISKKVSRFVLPPMAALYTFGALFLIYHIPVVLTFLSQSSLIHNGYLFVLLVLSVRMWRPIAIPNEQKYSSNEQNKRYLFMSGLVLMPVCLLFIITALIGSIKNPLLTQITANLCISPSQFSSLDILPSPFNSNLDQIFAGFLMIGMHKFGLILTVRLRKKAKNGIVVDTID
jgi:cytochrome c oxidase assembly factor CtaG